MIRKLLMMSSAAAMLTVTVVATSPARHALAGGRTECNGAFSNMRFNGGVEVLANDSCILSNVVINGGLQVVGGQFGLQNSRVNGGISIDNLREGPYNCGDTINGGIVATHIDTASTLSFGEANDNCPGGTINGGVSFTDNPSAFLELDLNRINGGLQFTGNTGDQLGSGEIEGNDVRGGATCSGNTPPPISDGDGGPNRYTGRNNGCPA